MNKKLIYLLFIIIPVLSYAQSTSLFDTYGIRTYSTYDLYATGQDLFSFNKSNNLDEGSSSTTIHSFFSLSGRYFSQSKQSTHQLSVMGLVLYNYNKNQYPNGFGTSETINEQTMGGFSIVSKNNYYLTDEKGFFAFVDPMFELLYYFRDDRNNNFESIPLGIGYGRIINVKSVVQATIINDELDANLTDEDLMQLAEIIEKYDNSYYDMKFKDNAEIEFFKDIASITKKPDQTSKIDQIINSSVYKTSQRQTGYEFKCGASFSFFDKNRIADYNNATDVFASINYALPIDFNKQFLASVLYVKNMKDQYFRAPKFTARLQFLVDHTYLWSSSLSAEYSSISPKDEIPMENYTFEARTSYSILNSLNVYLSFAYNKTQFDDNFTEYDSFVYPAQKIEEFSTHLGFNYYIF